MLEIGGEGCVLPRRAESSELPRPVLARHKLPSVIVPIQEPVRAPTSLRDTSFPMSPSDDAARS
jgi:hypothetical protein